MHARPDVAQQARHHPALGLQVVHPPRTSTAEICGRLRHSRSISLTDWAKAVAASSTSTLSRSNNSPSSSSTSATAASKGSDLVEKWL